MKLNTSAIEQAYVSLKHEVDKMLVFERAGVLFIFNFHPSQSFTDYRVGIEEAGEYHIALTSDESRFGGFNNIALDTKYFTTPMEWNGRKNFLQVGVLRDFDMAAERHYDRFIYPAEPALYLPRIRRGLM
jgi:1,4-alpha-glucan branching enzyme